MGSLQSPQVDRFIALGCLKIIKVHKWTSSSHKDALKLLVYKWMSLLLSPQVDEFITKTISGQIHYKRML